MRSTAPDGEALLHRLHTQLQQSNNNGSSLVFIVCIAIIQSKRVASKRARALSRANKNNSGQGCLHFCTNIQQPPPPPPSTTTTSTKRANERASKSPRLFGLRIELASERTTSTIIRSDYEVFPSVCACVGIGDRCHDTRGVQMLSFACANGCPSNASLNGQ